MAKEFDILVFVVFQSLIEYFRQEKKSFQKTISMIDDPSNAHTVLGPGN
jgi:hypothetical protein